MNTVQHPFHPWLYFPIHDGNIFILDFDQRILNEEDNRFIRYLEPFEIDRICQRIVDILELTRLEWGYRNGVCKIWIGQEDLDCFYHIVNRLIRSDLKVYLNDGTNLSLSRRDYPITQEREERLFLEHLQSEEKKGLQAPHTTQLAIHRTKFWNLEDGKEFALYLRKKYFLSDQTDVDYPTTSEIYGEKLS